jgi:hypothetical protein
MTKRKLNRLTIIILVLVLSLIVFERIFLVGLGSYEEDSASKSVPLQDKSIVVLPFLDFSPEALQNYGSSGALPPLE